MRETPTPPEGVLTDALRLLATRQRGASELGGRLVKKGHGTREVTWCLRWLQERGLLDDAEFSRALARDRVRFSPRSPNLLRRELIGRGIDPSVAEDAVERVVNEEETSEGDLAEEAARGWVRKQGQETLKALVQEGFPPDKVRARQRLIRFLARRGFGGGSAQLGVEAGEDNARRLLQEKH